MNVLVTGAGGFLGRHVVSCLRERSHAVTAMIRPHSGDPAGLDGVRVVTTDLRVPVGLEKMLDGIDTVVHVAAATSGDEDSQFAATVVGTENLLTALADSKVKRLVLISSLVVYDWTRARGTLDESTAINDDFYDMGAYHIAKSWQERIVRRAAVAASWDLTILRPGFIWGRDHTDIAGMGRRAGPFYVLIGPFTRLPLTHVENCADAIAAATDAPAAANNSMNIVDDDRIRVWRYARAHARGHARPFLPVPVPYTAAMMFARLVTWTVRMLLGPGARLPSILAPRRLEAQFKPLRFDNSRLRQMLEWTPPFDWAARIARSFGPGESPVSGGGAQSVKQLGDDARQTPGGDRPASAPVDKRLP